MVALASPVSGAPQAQIVVPVIIPLTGGNAFAGSGQRTALTLLQALVNRGGGIHGRSVVFDIHDSGSNSRIAVQMANQYVNNGVPLFIGDSSLATCAAIIVSYARRPAPSPRSGQGLAREDAVSASSSPELSTQLLRQQPANLGDFVRPDDLGFEARSAHVSDDVSARFGEHQSIGPPP